MRVLVVSEKRILRELLSFFLEGVHLMDVVESEGVAQALEILKNEDCAFDLIVCNYNPDGPQLIQYVFSQGIQLHFMCAVEEAPIGPLFKQHKAWFHWMSPNKFLLEINNTVISLFKQSIKDTRPANLRFARIKTQLLPILNPLAGDVHVRLSETKYLRMIHKNDFFDQLDLEYFLKKKSMPYLYLRTDDCVSFAAKLNNLIYGRAQVVKPPENHKNERVEYYEQSLEKPPEEALNHEVQSAPPQDEAKSKAELEEKKLALLKAKEELLIQKAEAERKARIEKLTKEVQADLTQNLDKALGLGRKIGFTEEVQKETKKNVLEAIAIVRRAPRLSEILARIRREQGQYINSHSMLLAFVSCALATKLQWTNDMTYQKLTLAAFLHDSSMVNHKLAAIQSIAELQEKNQQFTVEELQLYKEHPNYAADIARKFQEIPPDVDLIISQHHERPDGTGFPRGLNHARISPLAVVFIVAHDFVNFLIKKESAGEITAAIIDEFVRTHGTKFASGNFRKVLVAAKMIKA